MKLRIRGNSIRLRLTRTEVSQVARGEPVEEAVEFAPASRLTYRLVPGASTRASLEGNAVTVEIPAAAARAWASGTDVAFKTTQDNGADGLYVLIEKDFACLKPREHQHEDESDLFPNPNEAHGHCGGA
jgi:hypothetical protein